MLLEHQSAAAPTTGAAVPHDRCQFSRHFERTAIDCPAFQRAQFIAATSYGKPLGTHVACSHVTVGELNTNQFYPRCSLGSDLERARWLVAMGPARIGVQRALGAEFERAYPDSLMKLIAAKAEALAAQPDGRASRLALASAVREFVAEFSLFVSTHGRRIEELGISPTDLTTRAKAMLGEWQHSSRLDLPGVDEQTIPRPEPTLARGDPGALVARDRIGDAPPRAGRTPRCVTPQNPRQP